jgi:3-dehydroquinate synthase
MIGVFSQPDFVICDPHMLTTLAAREFRAGFAEVVKTAAIKDESFFRFLEEKVEAALKLDFSVIEDVVFNSVKIKANVVEEDEREKGERRKLNFGHSIAHTLESITGMLHGEAVSIGMVLASRLSEKLGLLRHEDVLRVQRLLERFQLPVATDLQIHEMIAAMKRDKKREGDAIHMVLLDRIGNALTRKIAYNQLNELLHDLY